MIVTEYLPIYSIPDTRGLEVKLSKESLLIDFCVINPNSLEITYDSSKHSIQHVYNMVNISIQSETFAAGINFMKQ